MNGWTLMFGSFAFSLAGCSTLDSTLCDESVQGVENDESSVDTYPYEVEGIGMVFEPVAAGNTSIEEWADNRASAYGAQVVSFFVTDDFYIAILDYDDYWLFPLEGRNGWGTQEAGGGEAPAMITMGLYQTIDGVQQKFRETESSDFELYAEIIFIDLPVQQSRYWREDEIGAYNTEHPDLENTYIDHVPTWQARKDELMGQPAMLVWRSKNGSSTSIWDDGQFEIFAVYWLHPSE